MRLLAYNKNTGDNNFSTCVEESDIGPWILSDRNSGIRA